jgi:hypothetical protein
MEAGRQAIALMMEEASTSETSVNFYQIARNNNPEENHLQIYFCMMNEADSETT